MKSRQMRGWERWRMIIVLGLFGLFSLGVSSPLWLLIFTLPEQPLTRSDGIALVGGVVLGLVLCLHMQMTLDFEHLRPYNTTEQPSTEHTMVRGATLVVWMTAIINVAGNLLLGYEGMQQLIQSLGLTITIWFWFGAIQAWRHRPRS